MSEEILPPPPIPEDTETPASKEEVEEKEEKEKEVDIEEVEIQPPKPPPIIIPQSKEPEEIVEVEKEINKNLIASPDQEQPEEEIKTKNEPKKGGSKKKKKSKRTKFSVGTLIWVKVDDYPWWPAKIVDEALADEDMLTERIETDTNLCQFFGDNSILWVDCENAGMCKRFDSDLNFQDNYVGEHGEELKTAISTATKLINRKKKRKRKKDELLEERETQNPPKKRKITKRKKNTSLTPVSDVSEDFDPSLYPVAKKKKKKRRKHNPKNVRELVGDLSDERVEELFNSLKDLVLKYETRLLKSESTKVTKEEEKEGIEVKKILEELVTHRVNMNQLVTTKIGGVVNKLRNHMDEDVGDLSRTIILNWKNVVKDFMG